MRRDLRLDDNTALYHVLKTRVNVLPLFIFNSEILGRMTTGSDYRINFVYDTLVQLKMELEKIGSTILVTYGRPLDVFKNLTEKVSFANILDYVNKGYPGIIYESIDQFGIITNDEFIIELQTPDTYMKPTYVTTTSIVDKPVVFNLIDNIGYQLTLDYNTSITPYFRMNGNYVPKTNTSRQCYIFFKQTAKI